MYLRRLSLWVWQVPPVAVSHRLQHHHQWLWDECLCRCAVVGTTPAVNMAESMPLLELQNFCSGKNRHSTHTNTYVVVLSCSSWRSLHMIWTSLASRPHKRSSAQTLSLYTPRKHSFRVHLPTKSIDRYYIKSQ